MHYIREEGKVDMSIGGSPVSKMRIGIGRLPIPFDERDGWEYSMNWNESN
jgi:hypothetical protein